MTAPVRYALRCAVWSVPSWTIGAFAWGVLFSGDYPVEWSWWVATAVTWALAGWVAVKAQDQLMGYDVQKDIPVGGWRTWATILPYLFTVMPVVLMWTVGWLWIALVLFHGLTLGHCMAPGSC